MRLDGLQPRSDCAVRVIVPTAAVDERRITGMAGLELDGGVADFESLTKPFAPTVAPDVRLLPSCPTDSGVVRASTKPTRLVSLGDPLERSGAGNV